MYLLVSSVDESTLESSEQELLGHYHAALTARLAVLGKAPAAAAFELGVFESHFELALLDYCRFMAGWGWWGAAGYAQRRCREALARLPAALAVAVAAARA